MDRLPIETLAKIASQLKAFQEKQIGPSTLRLALFSTINTTWQVVIERETFRHIGVNTDSLPQLTAILTGPAGDRRIRLIQKLEFHYLSNQLPLLTSTQRSELREQQQPANESFSKSIKALFDYLKGWEERLNASWTVAAGQHQMDLLLGKEFRHTEAVLPMPPSHTEDIVVPPLPAKALANLPPEAPGRHFARRLWLGHAPEQVLARHPLIDVRYVSEEKLPELSIVSSMILYENHSIHPDSLMQILPQMTCLNHFQGNIFGEIKNLDRTREYRQGLSLIRGMCFLVWALTFLVLAQSQSLHLLPG